MSEDFRGLPIALGWFCAFMAGGVWMVHRAHGRQSVALGLGSIVMAAIAIGGLYFILLWENGFLDRKIFTENASPSLGPCASAPCYRGAENPSR